MLPIGDVNPSSIRPVMTWTLIVSNVFAFVWQIAGSSFRFNEIVYAYGYVPYLVLNQGTYYMFLTSMFLHADWWHLGGNMLFLWVFGDNIEDSCGHAPYFFFYLITGVFASLLFTVFTSDPMLPAIGASGAVSGVLGAYLVRFPHARIKTVVFLGYFLRLTVVPAYVMIGIWFVLQLVYGLLGAPGVAWWAHVGGFLAGAGLIRVFARREPH